MHLKAISLSLNRTYRQEGTFEWIIDCAWESNSVFVFIKRTILMTTTRDLVRLYPSRKRQKEEKENVVPY